DQHGKSQRERPGLREQADAYQRADRAAGHAARHRALECLLRTEARCERPAAEEPADEKSHRILRLNRAAEEADPEKAQMRGRQAASAARPARSAGCSAAGTSTAATMSSVAP